MSFREAKATQSIVKAQADGDSGELSSEITDDDVRDAVKSWKENAPDRYRDLIEAREYKGK